MTNRATYAAGPHDQEILTTPPALLRPRYLSYLARRDPESESYLLNAA